MSLLGKVLGKAAGGLIKTATGGLISPKIDFSPGKALIEKQQGSVLGMTGTSAAAGSSSTAIPAFKSTALAQCSAVFDRGKTRLTHPNKSTYVTRGGGTSRWQNKLILHPAGTECVTVRRRHVTNAKALRRAISRVKGFVKTYR